MRKPKPKLKLLLTGLLASWAVALSGCNGHLPPAPDIEMYQHFGSKALCSKTKSGDACPALPIDATQKFYMFSPAGMESLQNYIDSLIRALEAKAVVLENSSQLQSQDDKIVIGPKELRKVAAYLRRLKKTFVALEAQEPI